MRNQLNSLLALSLAATLMVGATAPAMAQFSMGGDARPAQPAWTQFKLDPKKTVRLNFRNANVDLVLDLYMRVSGITIIKDPSLTAPMTLSSPNPVKLNEAFEILAAALSVRNFDLVKEGNVMVIRPRRQQQQGGMGGMTPEMIQAMMGAGRSNNELKVYRIQFAAAGEVARVINEVFLQQQQMQNPFQQFFGGGGATFGGGGNNRFGGRGGGGGRGGFSFGGSQEATVRASSDDFSNSVIVNAPRDKQREVEDLIAEIDKRTEQPQGTRIFKLEFAAAVDLQPVIQNVLASNAPTGRGAQSGGNVPLFQRFQQAARTGTFQGGAGTVTADERSNSLVVTATADNILVVESLIKELDKQVPVAETTFVIPLLNARADAVADLINQAYGSRTGNRTGTQFGGGTNRTNQNNRANNRNTGNRNNTGAGGLGGGRGVDEQTSRVSADGRTLELAMAEEMGYNEAELMTQVRTQQGGFFGQLFGGGNQGRTQGSGGGLVRDANGRLVNGRTLDGQISVIPDPSTNSLIVVTSPENLQLIQQILAQLDRIPEQVMIETIIVEATLDNSLKMGVEWNYVQERAFGQNGVRGNAVTDFGLQGATTPGRGFRYSLTGGNLTAFLNALSTDNRFNVLSTPRIFTSNNVEAEINISQSVPYVLSTREDTNGNLTFNYAFQDVGIVLNVLPRISANGTVTLDVTQTANDLQGFTDFNAPIVNQRQASTTVSVKDGETIVLGGIMRTTVTAKTNKVPILGDIPILGELFKSRDNQKNKTELMVFLTPRIVRDEAQSRGLTEQERNRLSPGSRQAIDSSRPAPVPAQPGTAPAAPPKDPPARKGTDKKSGGTIR